MDVAPGAMLRKTIFLRAPREQGDYTASLQLAMDSLPVPGSEADIRIHVTENAPLNYQEPTFGNSAPVMPTAEPRLKEEPNIRVGLAAPEDGNVQIVSYMDDYRILNGATVMGVLEKTHVAKIYFDKKTGVYSFKGSGITFETQDYVRLEPVNDPHAVFEIMNLDRKVSWVRAGSFNQYRGVAEKCGKGKWIKNSTVWINELFLEDYMQGIAETSEQAPIEMIKANLVAARTYAYFNKGKYPMFDVVANTYDQLYLGYHSEEVHTNLVSAAKATRGMMVTYEGQIVILAVDTLAVRLTVPPIRPVRDFHSQVNAPCRAHQKAPECPPGASTALISYNPVSSLDFFGLLTPFGIGLWGLASKSLQHIVSDGVRIRYGIGFLQLVQTDRFSGLRGGTSRWQRAHGAVRGWPRRGAGYGGSRRNR